MPRSSDRGQTEPLAALAAVVAVGIGLSLYAGVLEAELPGSPDREIAESAIEPVESEVAPYGVALPSRLEAGQRAGLDGYEINVTLTVDEQCWQTGPPSPPDVDSATVRLGVRKAPAAVKKGTLRVRVWT